MKPDELARMAATGAQQPQEIMVTPEDLDDVKCANCGGEYFDMVLKIKRFSPLHPKNVSKQEQYAPIQVLVCKKCETELKEVNLMR